MSAHRRTHRRRERGQSLVEFAMMMPIFMLMVFGLIDLARMMQTHVTLQEGARDAARYAVTGRIDCVTTGTQNRDNCIKQAVLDRTKSLDNHTTVSSSFKSWDFPAYADPATANNAGLQCDAIEVDVSYDYKPITPMFKYFIPHVPLTASERMVNEPFGTCS